MSRRISIGTAQFGLPYGVANRGGQVSEGEARLIVQQARAAGCDTLDTAIAYGDSERCLGEIGVARWRVVSKLPEFRGTAVQADAWVQESVDASLRRLRIEKLHGLLLHRPEQLLGDCGEALYSGLSKAKERGCVARIGVSIYGPQELEPLVGRYEIDLVQAPFNVLDRRIAHSGWLDRLHSAGTEVHVRSVFLQGLLLMDAASRPAYFDRWRALWQRWHGWLQDDGVSALKACLGIALAQPGIDRIVVGVDGARQLQEIFASAQAPFVTPPDTLTSEDPDLVNPSRWRLS